MSDLTSRDGLRVVVPALVSFVSIVAATLFCDWFTVDINGADLARITLDLREARACTVRGDCASLPMSMIEGSFYPTLATLTFWGGVVFALLVLYQAGTRVLGGTPNEPLIKAGQGIGSAVIFTAVAAGYLFGPNLDPAQAIGIGFDFDRGWGPVAMLVGLVAGQVALYYTRERTLDDPPVIAIKPITPRPRPQTPAPVSTRVPLPIDTPPGGLPTVRSKDPSKPPVIPRTTTPTTPPPLRALANQFKGKIQFAVVTGDITVGGIDARREDGSAVLVMWRDVVGLVVRRLPPELDGHPFVDIVSTAGMTLRVLPWSKMTGEHLSGDNEGRVRSFLKIVRPRCPEAKLDRATQAYLDDASKLPAQLPNADMLAKHDQALA